jgi:hyperosmotically inducible protein
MGRNLLGEKNRSRGGSRLAAMLVAGFLCLGAASCCWVAAGAGAGAGYKAGTDERSLGAQASDLRIVADINAKLIEEKGIRSLNVDVNCLNGHVTVTGIVKSKEQVQVILHLARSVRGVKSVKNNLTLAP